MTFSDPINAAVEDLAGRIRRLPTRPVVGLFWACSTVLLPEAEAWAEHWGQQQEPALQQGLAAAYQLASTGARPRDAARLLQALADSMPPGESCADGYPTGRAQDCWICADVCMRVLVDPGFDAAPVIWYPLEPVIGMTTEELYGVSQLGSTAPEAQLRAVVDHPRVAGAVGFCRWASDFLRQRPSPTADDLTAVARNAVALAPPIRTWPRHSSHRRPERFPDRL
jgi:hypothetical protein